jgi:hypothetical protein
MAKEAVKKAHGRTYTPKGGEERTVEGREVCLREYARLHEIDVSQAQTVKALDKTIEAANLATVPNGSKPIECTDCGFPIRNEDTFCAFCGGDVSEHEDGGWDRYLETCKPDDPPAPAADKPGEGAPDEGKAAEGKKAGKKKQIHTIDRTAEGGKEADMTEDKKGKKGGKDEEGGKGECEPDKGPAVPLEERVGKIIDLERGLNKSGGETAWDIGQELYTIHADQSFTQAGFETFREFCEAPRAKKGLGMSNSQALNYMRVFQRYGGEEGRALAGKIGIMKAAIIANAPETERNKLLKPAADGAMPAEKMGKKEIAAKIRDARSKARDPDSPAPGRKPSSKFKALLELQKKTQKIGKDGLTLFKLDDLVGVEVHVDAKNGRVSFKPVGLSDSE